MNVPGATSNDCQAKLMRCQSPLAARAKRHCIVELRRPSGDRDGQSGRSCVMVDNNSDGKEHSAPSPVKMPFGNFVGAAARAAGVTGSDGRSKDSSTVPANAEECQTPIGSNVPFLFCEDTCRAWLKSCSHINDEPCAPTKPSNCDSTSGEISSKSFSNNIKNVSRTKWCLKKGIVSRNSAQALDSWAVASNFWMHSQASLARCKKAQRSAAKRDTPPMKDRGGVAYWALVESTVPIMCTW